MAIKLRRLTGTAVSRRGLYAKAPPEAIRECLNARQRGRTAPALEQTLGRRCASAVPERLSTSSA